jgi:hypothetical protein
VPIIIIVIIIIIIDIIIINTTIIVIYIQGFCWKSWICLTQHCFF